jgi:hypothetical protein
VTLTKAWPAAAETQSVRRDLFAPYRSYGRTRGYAEVRGMIGKVYYMVRVEEKREA